MDQRLKELKASDVMTETVFTANLDHTWKDVARKMSAKNIHHLVVLDDNNLPINVISTSDFIGFALNKDAKALSRKLRDTISGKRLITVLPDSNAYDAANLMNDHHVESVVVVNETGQLKGIVTPKDVMNEILFEDESSFD
ncbi:MAG: CBS domain-containing protein [Leptospiraceae bacterium]|nr:CBS domain-containing protein [Leptospiraceae bacterium]